ncbi:MAG TPA: hypothetical protein VIK78_09030 [Ruminiclostridium sp.]
MKQQQILLNAELNRLVEYQRIPPMTFAANWRSFTMNSCKVKQTTLGSTTGAARY